MSLASVIGLPPHVTRAVIGMVHLRALPGSPRWDGDMAAVLRAALDDARANPPLNCQALGKTMESIGGACKACHQDFRG